MYALYKDFMRTKFFDYKEILCAESFDALWRNEFPHVRLRRNSGFTSKCKVCEDLQVRQSTVAVSHLCTPLSISVSFVSVTTLFR